MEKDPSIGSGCWYLGQIYLNPDDKRVIVRKKHGYGWTLNFARPIAIPTLILTMAYVLAPFYVLDHFEVDDPWILIGAGVATLASLMYFCFWVEKRS